MSNKSKLTKCKHCDGDISITAKSCPHCGAKIKKPLFKRWWFWLFVAVLLISISSGGDNVEAPTNQDPPHSTITESSPAQPNKADKDPVTEAEVETEVDIPREYKSALKKAESYSNMMHMSKAAIYNQLVSEYGEKFTEEAATYAMENIKADWNANALAKAESYSETMHMSKAGIFDQLISEYGEQFTKDEAQYAIDNIVADWNANALAKAKSYQETMNMSPAAIRDQLVSEYGEKFTAEEADYAIEHLN